MSTPQIILIAWIAIGFGMSCAKHGQLSGEYSVWAFIIRNAIVVGLLTWGGFWQ